MSNPLDPNSLLNKEIEKTMKYRKTESNVFLIIALAIFGSLILFRTINIAKSNQLFINQEK